MQNLMIKDNNDKFPLDLAYEEKYYAICKFLISKLDAKSLTSNEQFCCNLHRYCEESIENDIP